VWKSYGLHHLHAENYAQKILKNPRIAETTKRTGQCKGLRMHKYKQSGQHHKLEHCVGPSAEFLLDRPPNP